VPAAWIALRRPLFVAFVIGCTVSLIATGRLTLTLVAGSMVGWAFVPLFEILGFAVAAGRRANDVSFSRSLDAFFVGHRPWTLLTIAFGATASFLPPWYVNAWSFALVTGFEVLAVLVAIRSWFIDVGFYRDVLGRSPRDATRAAIIQRLICWPATCAWFFGYAAWPLVTNVFAR
jgi:hypothetical protein